ncbi:FtsX-like permease family protein [Nocardioides lianchengensis]|uniref:Putative ABC transport system permease protein n=1 Tax=Nocardioides lianchengensis TaxID=1045774 RepID=A0A1G6VP56_9ACTN|nr:FtsX-like permease family protein [Nocardioides lianchengensis]NYG11250.1 putative ABC transport system permease protein [Nocardioides lianchengensis]SDD55440.1 putative ABC transport system permease protein [Nocardioides lianchengensis]
MSTWSLARRSAWAHRAGFTGTALVLVLAGLLIAVAGVLGESGLRDSGLLVVLAGSYAGTVLTVVVLVVAATVSLALRGRRRELALLRTVGATRGQLRAQVGTEVVLVALVAVPLGASVGLLLAPLLAPLLRDAGLVEAGATLSLSPLPVLSATVLLLPVAWLAARLSVRETLRAAPGPAARASAVETTTIGVVRRGAAVALALLGLAAALSPLVVPGTVGSAGAATSAFLLVGAAALAGPSLVGWAFAHSARAERFLGPAGRLGVANLRGFAQRLTLVVVPLALALTAGTAQTTVDRTVAAATETQLRDGLHADAVVTAPGGLTPTDVDAVTGLAGVTAVAGLATSPARVLTDADLDGVVDALAWEQTVVRSVAGDADLLDPDVSAGSLADLTGAGTIAVSSDATFETGFDLGDSVPVRWPDGSTSSPTVVAVYERGLGFGDYLVGPHTLDAHRTDRSADALLVDADAAGRAALAGLGLEAATPASYAADASSADAAERRLSTVLLLGLLGFVLLAAANALVMTTVRRRGELRLLRRTGATGRQLTRMVLVEALVTGALAWLVGTLAVVPTVLGVGLGMLGPAVPPVDLAAYAVLSLAALLLPVLTAVPAAAYLVRRERAA